MSVVAVDEETGDVHAFAKGSFERLALICDAGTVPAGYTQTANEYASDGMEQRKRSGVLASVILTVSYKPMPGINARRVLKSELSTIQLNMRMTLWIYIRT